MSDKINEMLFGVIAIVGTFITKRVVRNHDTLSERVTALEKVVLTKDDISGLESDVSMIVTHLINKGDTPK